MRTGVVRGEAGKRGREEVHVDVVGVGRFAEVGGGAEG